MIYQEQVQSTFNQVKQARSLHLTPDASHSLLSSVEAQTLMDGVIVLVLALGQQGGPF